MSDPIPFYWQQIDERLASLMLSKVSEEIRQLSHEDEQHIRFQNMGNGNSMAVPSERLKMHLLRSKWPIKKMRCSEAFNSARRVLLMNWYFHRKPER